MTSNPSHLFCLPNYFLGIRDTIQTLWHKRVSLKVLTPKYFRSDHNSTRGPKFSENNGPADQFSRNFGPPDQNFRRTKISMIGQTVYLHFLRGSYIIGNWARVFCTRSWHVVGFTSSYGLNAFELATVRSLWTTFCFQCTEKLTHLYWTLQGTQYASCA